MNEINTTKQQFALIALNCTRRLIALFTGPFLAAYFIQTSSQNLGALAKYYIYAYGTMLLAYFAVSWLFKRRSKLQLLRFGLLLNFIYTITLLRLGPEIIDHLTLIGFMYGISSSCHWVAYSLYISNVVPHNERVHFTVRLRNAGHIIEIIGPIVLGGLISLTDFNVATIAISIISATQILFSLVLPKTNCSKTRFNPISAMLRTVKNGATRRTTILEFLSGLSISDGALGIATTIVIIEVFHSSLNLGLITSVATMASIIATAIYGHIFSMKFNRTITIAIGFIPILAVLVLLIQHSETTIIIYTLLYTVAANLLGTARSILVYEASNIPQIKPEFQTEFMAIREVALDLGRVCGYSLLLLSANIHNISMPTIMIVLAIPIVGIGLVSVQPQQVASKFRQIACDQTA